MRVTDIEQAARLPTESRTESLYLPGRIPAAEMTMAQVRLGLCARCGGDLRVCRDCSRPCAFGRRGLALEAAQQEQREAPRAAAELSTSPIRAVRVTGRRAGEAKHAAAIAQTLRCAALMRQGRTLAAAAREGGYAQAATLRKNLKQYAAEVAAAGGTAPAEGAPPAPAAQSAPKAEDTPRTPTTPMTQEDMTMMDKQTRSVRLHSLVGDLALFSLDTHEGIRVTVDTGLALDGGDAIRPETLRELAQEMLDAVAWFEEDGRMSGAAQ